MQKNAHQRQKVNKVKCLKGQEDDKERVKEGHLGTVLKHIFLILHTYCAFISICNFFLAILTLFWTFLRTIRLSTIKSRSNGFQGTYISNLFRLNSVIANMGSKKKQVEGTLNLHLL